MKPSLESPKAVVAILQQDRSEEPFRPEGNGHKKGANVPFSQPSMVSMEFV